MKGQNPIRITTYKDLSWQGEAVHGFMTHDFTTLYKNFKNLISRKTTDFK